MTFSRKINRSIIFERMNTADRDEENWKGERSQSRLKPEISEIPRDLIVERIIKPKVQWRWERTTVAGNDIHVMKITWGARDASQGDEQKGAGTLFDCGNAFPKLCFVRRYPEECYKDIVKKGLVGSDGRRHPPPITDWCMSAKGAFTRSNSICFRRSLMESTLFPYLAYLVQW